MLGHGALPVVAGGSGSTSGRRSTGSRSPRPTPGYGRPLQQRLDDEGSTPCSPSCARLDPAAADAIEPNNGRRVVRALEVIALTGRPFSATMPTREFVRPDRAVGLRADREALDPRIDRRAARMFDAGLSRRPAGSSTLGLREGRTASRAVGYAQALAVLDGTTTSRMPSPTPRCAPGGSCAARSRGSGPTRGSAGSTRAGGPWSTERSSTGSSSSGRSTHRGWCAWLTGSPSPRVTARENDFVLVPDLDGALGLTAAHAAALADRRAGIGGDGVIRVVPADLADDPAVRAQAAARWFMDYRNADGSLSEMCGNGTRVFAAYLRREGLETADEFAIATRAGRQARAASTATGSRSTSGPGG